MIARKFMQNATLIVALIVTVGTALRAADEFTGSVKCTADAGCTPQYCVTFTTADSTCASGSHCWMTKCSEGAGEFKKCARGDSTNPCVNSGTIDVTCKGCMDWNLNCKPINGSCSYSNVGCLLGGVLNENGWHFVNSCTDN